MKDEDFVELFEECCYWCGAYLEIDGYCPNCRCYSDESTFDDDDIIPGRDYTEPEDEW